MAKSLDGALVRLDAAVAAGARVDVIRSAHGELMRQLRSNLPTPNWEAYPVGRDFFLQNWP
jgi:hypothetical protein